MGLLLSVKLDDVQVLKNVGFKERPKLGKMRAKCFCPCPVREKSAGEFST